MPASPCGWGWGGNGRRRARSAGGATTEYVMSWHAGSLRHVRTQKNIISSQLGVSLSLSFRLVCRRWFLALPTPRYCLFRVFLQKVLCPRYVLDLILIFC